MDVEPSSEDKADLSVLITVHDSDRAAVLQELHDECTDELNDTGLRYEFVFVVEKQSSKAIDELSRIKEESRSPVKVLVLGRQYGSATALSVGVDYASGDTILTIPAFLQVEPGALTSLISEIQDRDMALLKRDERGEGMVGRAIGSLLRFPLRLVLGGEGHHLRRSVLIFRREVAQAIEVFGNKDRYLPLLARRLGFEVAVVGTGGVKRRDGRKAGFSTRRGVRQFLDLLSIFFLTEFTQKPLRFFGFFGLTSFSGGLLICVYLTMQRLFMGVPLADKPMLLLGVLLIVLGALLLSIGLIGEMIIFTKGRGESNKIIDRII